MSYRPQDDGALCGSCFLYGRREGSPVPSELNGSRIVVVGEAPGCFVAGTPVTTPDGWARIETVPRGAVVLGGNGLPTRVLRPFTRRAVETAVIRLHGGWRVRTTPEHPVWAYDLAPNGHARRQVVGGDWVPAARLKAGACAVYVPLPVPRGAPQQLDLTQAPQATNAKLIPTTVALTPDVAFLLGLYLADGSARFDMGAVTWHLSAGYKEQFVERIVATIKKAFGLTAGISKCGRCINVHAYSRPLVRWFERIGDTYTKRVPVEVHRSPVAQRRSFLFGWYVGDGTHLTRTTKSNAIVTASSGGALDAFHLFTSLGVYPGFRVEPPSKKGKVPTYRVEFRNGDTARLAWDLPHHDGRNREIHTYVPGGVIVPVTEVEAAEAADVYNIETSSNDYCVPFRVHNSNEVECSRPFVGRSGQELMTALAVHGLRRSDVSLVNVLSCRPPGNELAKLEYSLNVENRRRKKLNRDLVEGEESYAILPHPTTCCVNRLRREVARFDFVICLGDTAFKAVTGMNHSITKMRGSALEGWFSPTEGFISADEGELACPADAKPIKILPTFHPALILRQRMWTGTFRGDIGRAIRWFRGQRNWSDPKVIIRPSITQLRAFLASPAKFFAWDLETDSKEPLIARIRCFGVGTTETVLVVPLLSTDGHSHFYTTEDERQIRALLATWLADPKILKVGHNSILYDRCVSEQQLGVTPARSIDTMLMHHDVDSELRHNLGFVGTTLTDIVAWKQDSEDVLNVSDEVLHERNWKDVAVTARIVEPLKEGLRLKEQTTVCANDHKVANICAGLHRTGMYVDPVARDAHAKRLLHDILHNRKLIRDAIGKPDFNPNSTPQLSELLFEEWGLPPVKLSKKTGAPSTDDDALREYRVNYNLTPAQKLVIEGLRKIRKAVKYRGTNILKLVRRGEHVAEDEFAEDTEEDQEEREYRRKKDLKKDGVLLADGRIHSTFSCHVATTGRLSSSDPMNMQNIDVVLRNMFVAAPGRVLVGADFDQVELRYQAAHWGLKNLLAIFHEGRDPHYETCMTIFGTAAIELKRQAEAWAKEQAGRKFKEHAQFKTMRTFGKRFRFGSAYGAKEKTIHRIITSLEDDDGTLLYPDVSVTECASRRRALLDADPEYEIGWANEIATWRKNGYLADRIWGRRRYFLNGEPNDDDDEESANEIRNFPIQCPCAHIMHEACFDIAAAIPFEKWGPGTGLVNQIHDAVIVECPEKEAKNVMNVVRECMTRKYPGLDITFTAETKCGHRWSAV